MRYFHDFQEASTGRVAVHLLREQLIGVNHHSELKSLRDYADWDRDKDGYISATEARDGANRAVDLMVATKMALDGDGDGVLSPSEYLLGVPPRAVEHRQTPGASQEKDENGWNPRQRNIVRSQDRNQDGIISPDELLLSQASRAANGYLNLLMLKRARACDRDSDGKFDLEEFAMLHGVAPGTSIPDSVKSHLSMRGKPRSSFTYMHFIVAMDHAAGVNKEEIIRNATAICNP
jgi:Ca2+-binding EF-hand superfamily protein